MMRYERSVDGHRRGRFNATTTRQDERKIQSPHFELEPAKLSAT
jgi:hypothetical protein